jgi:hypothetical protein
MADLMNSMNDNIYSTQKPLKNNNSCRVCGEEFDYRDDVKTIGNQVSSCVCVMIINEKEKDY